MRKFLKKFNDGEHLIKVVEPSLLQLVPKFFWTLIPALYAAGIGYAYYAFNINDQSLILNYVIAGGSLILLFWYIRFTIMRISTFMLITSDRLICVQRQGFFRKDVIELQYSQFKTVSCHTRGMIPSLLSVGEIVIDRGGIKNSISLKNVHHPQAVQDLIMKLQREYTYMRKFGAMGGENSNAPGDGYISNREMMFFLQRLMSLPGGGYASVMGGNNPASLQPLRVGNILMPGASNDQETSPRSHKIDTQASNNK